MKGSRTKTTLVVCAAFAALATGCVESTPYRYTAVVPGPRPPVWDGRTAEDGTLRLEGAATHTTVIENPAPKLHDTAVRVPETMLEGSAMLALVPGFEMGVRGAYGSYDWTHRSAAGTMPIPSRPDIFGIGPELHGTFTLGRDERFGIGLAASLLHYDLPYAEWVRTGADSPDKTPECSLSPTCQADWLYGPNYKFFKQGRETFWTSSFGVFPSYSFKEYGHIFGAIAAHTGFKNDGFTDRASNSSTLETAGWIGIVGVGYSIKVDLFRASGMLYAPLTSRSSSVDYLLGGFLTVGIDVPLWESKAEKRKRREEDLRRNPPPPMPPAQTVPVYVPVQPGEQPGAQQPGVQYIYINGAPPPQPAPPP